MCMTLGSAELSNTKLYAGEARRGDRYVHVIAYQNKASTAGPNAMVLPIPAAVMPGPENVVDTRDFDLFLDDIHRATQVFTGYESESAKSDATVFDVGSSPGPGSCRLSSAEHASPGACRTAISG